MSISPFENGNEIHFKTSKTLSSLSVSLLNVVASSLTADQRVVLSRIRSEKDLAVTLIKDDDYPFQLKPAAWFTGLPRKAGVYLINVNEDCDLFESIRVFPDGSVWFFPSVDEDELSNVYALEQDHYIVRGAIIDRVQPYRAIKLARKAPLNPPTCSPELLRKIQEATEILRKIRENIDDLRPRKRARTADE
jgi:hypothetical protein